MGIAAKWVLQKSGCKEENQFSQEFKIGSAEPSTQQQSTRVWQTYLAKKQAYKVFT